MRKNILGVAVSFAFLSANLSTSASASAFACQADPKAYLAVGGNGYLYVAVNNGNANVITAICSVTATDGPVTAPACMAWYSFFLSARTTGAKALPHFDSSEQTNSGIMSCADLKDWQHHASYFLLSQ